ncbi:hypothetical protein F2Q70_00022960 [Brassica cretica]|uniref:Leucine-rich repeat-containing N-terminal plant-type domain-containing protein n=1 Tax=Brassica cretica TaxID=69181 RepID=A0A8S9GVB4_BRACR|nr:hypothetical protein F2Q70_00022960 [Brassica cretica]
MAPNYNHSSSFIFLFLSLHFLSILATRNNLTTDRNALEIIIGGGESSNDYSPAPSPEPEDCPPPPPPEPEDCPPPPPPPPTQQFSSPLIEKVYPVIKKFQNLVENDPKKILKTWVGTDICAEDKYIGLECAKFPGTNDLALASIQFNQFNLAGKKLRLDNFLNKLEEVTIFHANSNNFVGAVPEVSNLKYLFELDLSNNKLSGEFPSSVLKATNLTFLDLRFNSFSGSVPPQVFNLDLDVLFINHNNLVQRLPENLGSITALYLTFANNRSQKLHNLFSFIE